MADVGTKAISFEDLSSQMWAAFDEMWYTTGKDYWLRETFTNYCVAFSPSEGLKKFPYTITDGKVVLGEPETVEVDYVPPKGKVFLHKTTTGAVRWLAISSNTFEDLDKETISEKALKHSMRAAKESGDFGELRLEHINVSRVGKCDGQGLFKGFLVETGTFDDNDRAKNCIKTLEADVEGKYKISVGFFYNPDDLIDGVYKDSVVIFERSITDHPANTKTAIGVATPELIEQEVEKMKDEQVYQRLVALVGTSEADKIVAAGNDGLKALYGALNAKYKAEEEPKGVEVPGTKTEETRENAASSNTPNTQHTENKAQQVAPPREIEAEIDGKIYHLVIDEEGARTKTKDEIIADLEAEKATLLAQLDAAQKAKAVQEDAPRVTRYRASKGDAQPSTPPADTTPAKPFSAKKREDFFADFAGGIPTQIGGQ